ncbi:MAG: hypothetical protein KAI24_26340 [Planctomycetes bacterium]|nr:hypothetical protein [Planctomycetota bacterium]
MPSTPTVLPVEMGRQPTDVSCGPTCLHAVYAYHGLDVPTSDLIAAVPSLDEGGTLGVMLARDALARGFDATIVTWNLRVFDPSWFEDDAPPLADRLRRRARARRSNAKLRTAAEAYADFVDAGGKVAFRDLTASLLRSTLRRGVPILTGLSATFLYREMRQRPTDEVPDDLRGDPVGHFVVLSGYHPRQRTVLVTDPMHPNPLSDTHTYPVGTDRLVGAIYLGVLTYDANLVIIERRDGSTATERSRG